MGNSICFSQQQKMVAYFPSIWHSIMHICIIWVCQIIELSFRKETFLLLRLFAWTTEWLAKGRVSSNFRWKKLVWWKKIVFLHVQAHYPSCRCQHIVWGIICLLTQILNLKPAPSHPFRLFLFILPWTHPSLQGGGGDRLVSDTYAI